MNVESLKFQQFYADTVESCEQVLHEGPTKCET